MRSIQTGRRIFNSPDGAFDLLRMLSPGLIVDVGAAAGLMTTLALKKSPGSRAICFEPFPGNWRKLEAAVTNYKASVRIVKEAVADKRGKVKFLVASIAKPEGAWAGYEGYSSVGMIIPDDDPRASRCLDIPVTTIDHHVQEPVRFLKIDVQGGEMNVLRGATETLKRGVDVMHVEFGGERDVLGFLLDHGYTIYDQRYLLLPTVKEPDWDGWTLAAESTLSTGDKAYVGWPDVTPTDPDAFCALFDHSKSTIGVVQTDLAVVAPYIVLPA